MSGRGTVAAVAGEMSAEAAALRRLTRTWRWWCLAGAVGLSVGSILLLPALGADLVRWVVPNLLALAAIQVFVLRNLRLNRRSEDGPLLGDLGPGTQMTVLRGVLIAQLPGYLFLPRPVGAQAWLPALTFSAVVIADFLDGYLARRASVMTRLGEALDIEFDGIGLLAATALAAHYGQLPVIYLLTVGSARYLYLLAGWTARRLGRPVYPLPPSTTRRALAGVTLELGTAALWPIAPPAMMTLGGTIVGLPFLTGFVRDGLVHLGFLDTGSTWYTSTRRRIVHTFTFILPPFLRGTLLLILGPQLALAAQSVRSTAGAAGVLGGAILLFIALCLFLVVSGFAGRTGAVGLIIVYGLTLAVVGPFPSGVAAWGCAMAIYLLGTGAGSLWQPERAIYLRRAGGRG